MREAEKEKEDEGVREPDNESEESEKDQSMSDGDNEDETEDDLRIPIHQYLAKGTLPTDVKEARKLESKAAMYRLRDGILYKRSFLGPLMRCLSRTEGRKILHDIHNGDAGNHSGRRSLAVKMQGYYWLSMEEDSKNVAKRGNLEEKISYCGYGLFHQMGRSKVFGKNNGHRCL
ncbi:uncharacterized protein LOC113279596 [Papaver somniferum]|uniref:uncharacterized protein LOC113279596 n=1 Tax=Papaver somniferum TaxID=3469 RepID=UPI000E6FB869|nr:uncharacterized protein LOC113279596 [Papaver somniferum]